MALKKGETFVCDFDDEITSAALKVDNAYTVVKTADTDRASVKYTAGASGKSINVGVVDGVFTVEEKGVLVFGTKPSELEITLPNKTYESFRLKGAAGTYAALDLSCGDFSAEIASGMAKFCVNAENISLEVSSGETELIHTPAVKVKTLKLGTASGKHKISGYGAESFYIKSASGRITAEGISGNGNIDIASGSAELTYSEWDGDLDVNLASGKLTFTLPENSGAALEVSALSGKVKSTLDGSESKFSGNTRCNIGGGNIRNVKLDMMSGTVTFQNRANPVSVEK